MYGDDITSWPWAADNDAFSDWNEQRFLRMLDRITGRPGCLFVSAPDVVGDAQATLERFREWLPRLKETGQPLAFVAQDGIDQIDVPWDDFDCLFVGGKNQPAGTVQFKLGPVAADYVRQAKERGKWVHMGRVNTRKRIRYAKSIGCDSIDGTNFSMFRRTNLPWALTLASSEQLWPAGIV